MKIGILGGSFDPIHKGHMHMAISSLKTCGLDQIWLIPAGHAPHKDEDRMTSAQERLHMCSLAAADYDRIIPDDYEIKKEGKSYTYLTLQAMKEMYPQHEFYFIMGGDSLDYFERWRHPEIIASCAIILVVVREGFDMEQMQSKIEYIQSLFPCDIRLVPCERFDISSTEIRKNITNSKLCLEVLDPQVYGYILERKLYQ